MDFVKIPGYFSNLICIISFEHIVDDYVIHLTTKDVFDKICSAFFIPCIYGKQLGRIKLLACQAAKLCV